MRKLAIIPALLSSLLLAAHFLRSGSVLLAGLSVLAPLALLASRVWATRLVQLFLYCGALVWVWTMLDLARTYAQDGRRPTRMIVILVSVAAFTSASAALL